MPVILFWKNDLYIWSYFLDIQTILSRMPQSAVIFELIDWGAYISNPTHVFWKNNDLKYYACNIVLKERSIHLIIFPGYSDYSKSNAAIRSHFRLNMTEQRAFQIIVMYSEKIMIWSIMPVILFWKNDLYIWSYFLYIETILSRMPQSAVIFELIGLSSVHFKSHPCILKK